MLAHIIVFFLCQLSAQTSDEVAFLNNFKKQSLAGKVKAYDTLKPNLKSIYYPLVKAELESIRQQAIRDNKTDILDRLIKIDGELYFQSRNYSKAIPIFTDLLIKNKITTAEDSAQVLYFLKNSYVNIHSLKKATDIHKVLVKLKKSHPEIDAWLLHPKLSTLYYEMKLYKECLNQQLLEYDETKKDDALFLGYYNNRGLFWSKYGHQDSALKCYNKARALFQQMHSHDKKLSLTDEFTIGLIEGNIGQAYIELKEYYKAIPLLKKDVIYSVKSRNFLNAAISQIELSRCYMSIDQMGLCKKYLDSAALRLADIDDYKTRLNIIKQYALYYEKVGQTKLCIEYYKKYNFFKDSTDATESLKELVSAQITNQMQEKESMILDNEKKIKERTLELSQQKTIQTALFFGGLILVIIIIIMISSQLKKTNSQKLLLELKNKQIETRNDIINKSLVEKDLLIKEVHHRVKNNLQIISSLLKLQSGKTQNPEILNSLREAQDRINSMALLHQLLYRNNDVTSLLFNEYLSVLILQISSSFASTNSNVKIESKLTPLELDLDTAIPLGLITNELMSNAYKHAFNDGNKQGEIKVELSKLFKNTYMLKISDNGIGLPGNFDITNLDSLGLDIVSILADQISAELKIYNDNGAHFEIHFNKK